MQKQSTRTKAVDKKKINTNTTAAKAPKLFYLLFSCLFRTFCVFVCCFPITC